MNKYPKQKDIIIIDSEPHSGKEYGGYSSENIRRPMIVVSSDEYNQATGMIIGMPITSADKSAYPLLFKPIMVTNGDGTGIKGYVIMWQLQNFDFYARNGVIVNRVSDSFFSDLQKVVKDIHGIR
ncbi:type II toxin-antitoxin system PemK/MazF family toxin [Enterococcus cecorum]|uniref:type II toxin-antitoxin system PemK/MazF family toxin n=1 Tax=Enterococcus cecorum TaxID=44008 RepID=UPI00326474B8